MSTKIIFVLIFLLLTINGCVPLTQKFNTDNLWEEEILSQNEINYKGIVSKITIGNIRPTIRGKSKKHLDKKFDIKIEYSVKERQVDYSPVNNNSCHDIFTNNGCLTITARLERADYDDTNRLVKKIKSFPLENIDIFVSSLNGEARIYPKMCSKMGDDLKRVPYILRANLSSDKPPSGIYCLGFRQRFYEYEISLTPKCETNEDDMEMLGNIIPIEINEQCTLQKTEVTAGKIIATPFAVGADILNIPVILIMMAF